MKFPVSVIAPAVDRACGRGFAVIARVSNASCLLGFFPASIAMKAKSCSLNRRLLPWNRPWKSPDKKELAGGWPHPYAGIRA
jgi:hypothetical protein